MIRLLITSGRGPAECRIAVKKVVGLITKQAAAAGVDVTQIDGPEHSQGHGSSSIVLILDGDADAIAAEWVGTIQWIAQSPVRPNHKRKNWFVSVSALSPIPGVVDLKPEDVVYEAFRAGGPGGQHQNTTDSAVRATHKPTKTVVVVREERSQHRNRSIAFERIAEVMAIRAKVSQGKIAEEAQRLHDALERGNPKKVLKD